MNIDVLVELKAKEINQTFTYSVPKELESKIQIGIRVLVPFGRQKLEGFVLSKSSKKCQYELKDIIDIIDSEPILNSEMLKLGEYISKKTLCSLISAYQTMLPSALKAHKDFNVNKKYITYLTLINKDYQAKNSKQKEVIDILAKEDTLKSKLNDRYSSSIKTLLKNGIISEKKEEVYRLNDDIKPDATIIELTKQQKKVVDNVLSHRNSYHPFLLHGVTGSGKTEVYMHIIEEVIKEKEVIVLVPEISLTPQLVDTFRRRFGNNIAIMHSRLSDGERYDEWRKVVNKEVKIVIGARSAIFVPFTNLGLIIIDEEHSDTYKQESTPRYNAIDIALKRSQNHKCPLVLGSATPSIESYTRAKLHIYELLEMPNRINNQLPEVSLIDMKHEVRKGNAILSSVLQNEISKTLSRNEQVILLLNRRGYSTTVICQECGYTLKCPNCDIPLTYHKKGNNMVCHYCNYTTYKPFKCPDCQSSKINSLGLGTEKLQEVVEEMFKVKTIRMDIDTTRRKGSHERIINQFRNKDYPILIGTQMISKGLDFDNVTLVGVINGDASLNIPDYRSAERTFDLLNQVAGRSGRSSKKGKVVIQGFNIDHYSIVKASKHDYRGFYDYEMNIRKLLHYPPYVNLTLIKISGYDFQKIYNEALKISNYLKKDKVTVLGPSSGNMPKINNKYYLHIILKYKQIDAIYSLLVDIRNKYLKNKKVNVDIDINPKKI